MLDIVPSCRNLVQYFEPNFGPNVLPLLLGIVPSYHPIHFKGKLTNLTRENGEKSDFRPNFDKLGPNLPPPSCFSWVLFLLVVRHCPKLSSYASSV